MPGAIFSQLVLADEVNRASPKTQSALLEAMEERQVTAEGETRPLPDPFFVVATQNPSYQLGTFPLPERSEEHTSELHSLMRTSYAVFCLKQQNHIRTRSFVY